MALNLSTLTSPATSGDVLAEALTTADFLENVPVLRNLARGSQKGGDAKQDVALNQPKALPLIKNPAGDLGGYLYIPDVAGNYAEGPSVTIGSNQTWQGELDMVVTQWGSYIMPMGCGDWTAGFGLLFYPSGYVRMFCKGVYGTSNFSGVTLGTPFNVKYGFDGTDIFVDIDGVRKFGVAASSQSTSITHPLQLNQQNNLSSVGNYAIQKAKLTVNSAVVFDCDFNGSTSIRHGDTKFQAAVGGPVVLNQSGNDPATVIKKSVLRFDGVNSSLQGLLVNNINSGYMFAAFSVLGDGGEPYGRVFSVQNSTEGLDYTSKGVIFSLKELSTNDLASYYGSNFNVKNDLFDDDNGDILHEVRILNNQNSSKTNNTAALTDSRDTSSVDSDTFNISRSSNGASIDNVAIDLEYLAVFPVSITDAQADDVRKYINNRNNVFDLKDGFGYYFYDATKAPVGAITTGSSAWNGRIVGSDNGDSDRYATQGTTNDAPVGDGYVVTFADNADHLDIPQVTQAGWQVVGTSLGTFAYRVNANAVTELNLLGNFGHANTRQTGDLYGIILLPESATGADIESARKLLIDRGSSDALSATVLYTYWYQRADIVHFENVDMSSAVNVQNTWDGCSNMVTFEVTDISNGNNFSSAWNGCSALTSFPAGAKLGTSAQSVNFKEAWRDSGLTSFPALDLSNAINLDGAWRGCNNMLSFALVDTSSVTNFNDTWLGCASLTSFPLIDTSSGTNFYRTWYDMDSVTDFPLLSVSAGRHFNQAWRFCVELINFPAGLFDNWNPSFISSGVFRLAWDGCTRLTAQSVENILTSIDASGQYATSDGDAYVNGVNTQLASVVIDIDYNVATGSLSAATNSAIDSLSGKGWEVYINGVLVIPNILDLQPAAAYSLRSFDADADPNVVNVRRSSDNATSDFKASEVSDGTLVAFVGAGNDGHVTTWYDQGGTNHASQPLVSKMPLLVDGGTLVTEGGLPSIYFPTELSNLSLDHSDLYGQATLDSYYVTNVTENDYIYPSILGTLGGSGAFGMTAQDNDLASITSNYYGTPAFYANGVQITSPTRDSIHTTTSGGQKLVTHVGAETLDTRWQDDTMNFGNYVNNQTFGYTGKLQEMIFFNTDQSANRTGIENNINDTYTIY
jgi:hypothetical protein